MPCDEIRTFTMNLEKADIDVVAKALEAMGYTVTKSEAGLYFRKFGVSGTFNNGKLEVNGRDAYEMRRLSDSEEGLTRYVGVEAAKQAAEQNGFEVKQNPNDPFEFEISKDTFQDGPRLRTDGSLGGDPIDGDPVGGDPFA